MLWSRRLPKRNQTLLSFNRVSIRLLVDFERMGYTGNDLFKSSLDLGRIGTTSFMRLSRFTETQTAILIIVNLNFNNLKCLNDVPLVSLLRFMKST